MAWPYPTRQNNIVNWVDILLNGIDVEKGYIAKYFQKMVLAMR
jgi:hypothetical protein